MFSCCFVFQCLNCFPLADDCPIFAPAATTARSANLEIASVSAKIAQAGQGTHGSRKQGSIGHDRSHGVPSAPDQAATGVRLNRVGGGVAPAVLPHHRTYGSRIRRFLPSRCRAELTSRGLFARQPVDAATALGTSGPYCSVASSFAGQLSRLNEDIATFPLSADSALRRLVGRLLWRLLTPSDPSRHLSMSVARGRPVGLPG